MKILETLDSCECTSLSHSFIDVIEDLLKISILIDTSLVLLRFHGLLTFWSAYPKKKKKRSGLQPGMGSPLKFHNLLKHHSGQILLLVSKISSCSKSNNFVLSLQLTNVKRSRIQYSF